MERTRTDGAFEFRTTYGGGSIDARCIRDGVESRISVSSPQYAGDEEQYLEQMEDLAREFWYTSRRYFESRGGRAARKRRHAVARRRRYRSNRKP